MMIFTPVFPLVSKLARLRRLVGAKRLYMGGYIALIIVIITDDSTICCSANESLMSLVPNSLGSIYITVAEDVLFNPRIMN